MFGRLIRKLKAAIEKGFKNPDPGPQEELISPDLRQNLDRIGAILSQSPDVVIRQFTICIDNGWPAAIIYIDELADKKTINDHILRPLMVDTVKITAEKTGPLVKDLRWIEDHLISVNELSRSSTLDQVVAAVIKGDTALLVQGFTNGLQISSKGWEKRALSEPEVEVVLKGPRDGFIENLRTNTALIRRKIAHPDLTFEPMRIGRKTRTDLFIAYIRGIAREDLVAEVRRRIERIDTDSVLAAANVSEFIEDAPFSIFPTTAFTERPDVAAAKLLDGRIAIIIDGTPTVYTVPALFIEGFQSPDDYHLRPYYATLIRWVRYLAFSLTVFLPALYVAMASFHQELVPTPLLLTLLASAGRTPFPVAGEILIMIITFELLREAGLRLPRAFGSALSIVGALVIGEAAVGSGLVGEPTDIVIAMTAIASYVIPFLAETAALLRLFFLILAGIFGLFGMFLGGVFLLIHLASLRSFGVPFFAPFTPLIPGDFKDTVIRAPQWALLQRPRSMKPQNEVREASDLRPKPPDKDND